MSVRAQSTVWFVQYQDPDGGWVIWNYHIGRLAARAEARAVRDGLTVLGKVRARVVKYVAVYYERGSR